MPGALEAVDGEEVDAEGDGALRVPDRGALVQHGAAGRFELPDHGPGRVAGRFDNRDAGVDDGEGVGVVVGGHEGGEQGQVHAEGVRGHGSAALDLAAEVGGGGLGEGCELFGGFCWSTVVFGGYIEELAGCGSGGYVSGQGAGRATYYSQTASVRYRGGQFGVADPLHSSLHDRNYANH